MLLEQLSPYAKATLLVTLKAKASARKDNNLVHRAADANYKQMMLVVSAAFMRGRKAYKAGGTDAAVKAIKTSLLQTLPKPLAACAAAAGQAELESLSLKRNAGYKAASAGQPRALAPFTMAFNVSDPKAVKWAKEHAAELADGISETSRERIKDAVARAMEAGSIDESYDDILEAVGSEDRADMIARTETMNAANEGLAQGWDQAVEAGLLPENAKKVWIATSGACDECDEVDGEEVPLDDDFSVGDDPPLHPNSIAAGVVVEGNMIAATRMSYAGQVREIIMASGRTLTVTPNHAVATLRGFVPSRQVEKGEYLLAYNERIEDRQPPLEVVLPTLSALSSPLDDKHGPAAIEQVFHTLQLTGKLVTTKRVGNEFHGDAAYGNGDIDIVYADVELGFRAEAALMNQRERLRFKLSNCSAASLGDALVVKNAVGLAEPPGVVALRAIAKPAQTCRIGATSHLDTALLESGLKAAPRDAGFVREMQQRLAGLMSQDEVVEIRDRDYFGHVYDLTTVSEVIVANSFVISNCRCTMGIAEGGD